jgi:hypothetical protein
MDHLLKTSINVSNSDLAVYVYDGASYNCSITGDIYNTEIMLVVSHTRDDCFLVSLDSIQDSMEYSYKQNSVVSPQRCSICKDTFEFGYSCMSYNIPRHAFDETFPTDLDIDKNSSGNNSTSTKQSSQSISDAMSHTLSQSSEDETPLIHVLFETKSELICKTCLSSMVNGLNEIKSDPELISKRI